MVVCIYRPKSSRIKPFSKLNAAIWLMLSFFVGANFSDTPQSTFPTQNLRIKAENKGTPPILQTQKVGRKGKLLHSPRPKMAILFTSYQSAFRFHAQRVKSGAT